MTFYAKLESNDHKQSIFQVGRTEKEVLHPGTGEVVQRLKALADSREPRFNYHDGSKPSVTPASDLTPSSGLRLASEGNMYVVHKHAGEQNTKSSQPGVAVHTCYSSTCRTEAGRSGAQD